MRRILILLPLSAMVVAGAVWQMTAPLGAAATINLSDFISFTENAPIGIDFHEPSGKLIVTAHYPGGEPNNLDLIDATTRTQFSSLHGLTNELKVATVRSGAGPCIQTFVVGETFTGNGHAGEIVRISPNGLSVQNPWVILPGEPALVRGSLFQDRYCSINGDLVVVTGNEQNGVPSNDNVGSVWRVTSGGLATKVVTLNTHLEGVTTVPNNPFYGPLAGKILAGAEHLNGTTYIATGEIYVIDPVTATFKTISNAPASATNFHIDLDIHPEDIDIITKNAEFFGVAFRDGKILTAPSSDFDGRCGQILLTQEFPGILFNGQPTSSSGLSTLNWNPVTNSFEITAFTSSRTVQQWEHVTFKGGDVCITALPKIKIIKKTNGTDNDSPTGPIVPVGSTVTWTYIVTNPGNEPLANVVVTDDNGTPGNPADDFHPVFQGGDANSNGLLDTNETWTYAASATAKAGQYENFAVVTGTGSTSGQPVTDRNPDHYFGQSQTGKSITIGPSTMEGAIKISAGDWVNGGYSFKTNFTGNITIDATVSITGACLNAAGQKLNTTDTIVVSLGSISYAAVQGSDWKPTGDANSILSWQGSIIAPATLCGGGGNKLDASKGAVFDATITGVPQGGAVTFRFKFRDPAAKGKPNTNCLDAGDPNRNRADVCGASWSSTKIDP